MIRPANFQLLGVRLKLLPIDQAKIKPVVVNQRNIEQSNFMHLLYVLFKQQNYLYHICCQDEASYV